MPKGAPQPKPREDAAASTPAAAADRSATLLLWGVLLAIALGPLSWYLLLRYRHGQAHDEQFRSKYHLSEQQLARIRALEKEHQERYRVLVERAEATTRDLEMRLYPGMELNAELRDIVAQAQREREACWEEEIFHHRQVGEVMGVEDGQRYLAGWQARYEARRNAPNGLLIFPHR